jgi:hypothetical protein
MPKVFRAMREENGQPKLGASSSTLGVRLPPHVPADLPVAATGDVDPGTGGMSVSPSAQALPYFLLERVDRGQVGATGMRVWSLGSGPFEPGPLTPQLALRPDPANKDHGFVEPLCRMPAADYQAAIAATRCLWQMEPR